MPDACPTPRTATLYAVAYRNAAGLTVTSLHRQRPAAFRRAARLTRFGKAGVRVFRTTVPTAWQPLELEAAP